MKSDARIAAGQVDNAAVRKSVLFQGAAHRGVIPVGVDAQVGNAHTLGKRFKAGETVTVNLPTGATMKLTIKSVEVHR